MGRVTPLPADPDHDPEQAPAVPPAADELLEQLGDGIVVADAAGRVSLVTGLAARMLEVDAATALGRPLHEVLALQDQEGRDWVTRNAPYTGLSTRSTLTEQAWLLRSGVEVLVVARLIRSQAGGPVERVVVTLRPARWRERLDRERSDLVATVAHELRSPLTGVKGFVRTLLTKWDKLTDDQKRLMLTTVHSDADRLTRLIAELLDVARIDTGRLSLFPRPVDAHDLVTRAVGSVRAATARTIEVVEEPSSAGLPRLFADPDKFLQVLTNILENAVRHGDGVVRVTLAAPSGPDGPVRITVDDEGAGIPLEIRRRAFTKFWQHGGRGGSGLGLYIVNGLTRAHGGTVEITDAPAGGARVVLAWPTRDQRPD